MIEAGQEKGESEPDKDNIDRNSDDADGHDAPNADVAGEERAGSDVEKGTRPKPGRMRIRERSTALSIPYGISSMTKRNLSMFWKPSEASTRKRSCMTSPKSFCRKMRWKKSTVS